MGNSLTTGYGCCLPTSRCEDLETVKTGDRSDCLFICFLGCPDILDLGYSFQSGFHFRKWLEVKQPNVNEVVGLFLKILFWPLILAFQWANSFVKKYLGWEVQFDLSSSETTPETTGETSTPPKDSLTN